MPNVNPMMKILLMAIILGITFIFIVLLLPQTVFATKSPENFTPEKQFPLWKNSDGNNLILNQTVNKTAYNTWEPITLTRELINNGTHTITMHHYLGWIAYEVIYPSGVVWPQTPIGIPLIFPPYSVTLEPPGHLYGYKKLDVPNESLQFGGIGKYTITSFALFSTSNNGTLKLLLSNPIQITVIPEFGSLAGMIIVVSIIGVIALSRFRFHF